MVVLHDGVGRGYFERGKDGISGTPSLDIPRGEKALQAYQLVTGDDDYGLFVVSTGFQQEDSPLEASTC